MNVSTSEPLSVDQVRILLAEGVDLCARYASSKLTVLDDDCDPDALQRRYGGTLQCSCPRVFDSVRDFEGHYANRHRLACVQCHTSLPTVHLLELHIAESHDPLFAAADRLKYQCVVEGCVERFASVSDRKQHAVEVHSHFLQEPCRMTGKWERSFQSTKQLTSSSGLHQSAGTHFSPHWSSPSSCPASYAHCYSCIVILSTFSHGLEQPSTRHRRNRLSNNICELFRDYI
ncbi:zinc finger protein 511 lethal (2) k10201 isoform X1 [Amblyomma americanum]